MCQNSSNFAAMKKAAAIFFPLLFALIQTAVAQCSICAKTAQQMGEKPALGLNSGILYLMAAPFLIVGFIAFRWWKSNEND